jgi:ribosomal protein L11 methyltransferase
MIRLAVRVRAEEAELVLAELLPLAPGGVEEVELGDGVVEYAVYGASGELPELPDVRAAAGGALVEVTSTEVADDWAERWRAFHRPIEVGEAAGARLYIRPPWEAPREGLLDICVDPGQAFGTGAHHTTRLCLEFLAQIAAGGGAMGPLMDLGCGSGVLAIAAAKLGWAPVRGVDHELESVEATAENAAVNGVTVDVARADLLRDGPAPSAPTVTANLLRPLLLHIARTGFAGEAPRTLVASGLLAHEADEVAAAFEAHGLREAERRHGGEWAALLLTRD